MRLHRCMPVLAAVVSLAGVSAPIAQASEAVAPSGGISQPAAPTVVPHQSAGSADWVIGIGTATTVALLGTGAAVTLRNRRPVAASTKTRAAS
jgi:hypothetical protein